MQAFSFDTAKSIISEPGATAGIAEYCRQLAISRPLIVTDNGIKDLGLLARLSEPLAAVDLNVSSFSDVVADPPESTVYAAVEQGRQHDCDGVIGFGGGSSLDTAKLVALLLSTGDGLQNVYGVNVAKGSRLPLILIPTTAGTGSEVTPVAIVTTGETTKQGVVAPQLLPDLAILDAELTLQLPAAITAMTGVDAMVHAIEAYTSLHRKNPYSDMLAREALALMSANILAAVEEGNNLEARQAMLLGACLAGQAFANAPVAAVHALAYPLGGQYHIPHGLSNSLVLPHVLRFNEAAASSSYEELLAIVSVNADFMPNPPDSLAGYCVALIKRLKLPATLEDAGVPEKDLAMLAREAMLQQRLLVNNPRPVMEADALAIYRAAYR